MQTDWRDRYPYLEYIRHVDVRTLIEANRVCDTGADSSGAVPENCILCDRPASPDNAVRLNHGKWVCGTCFVELQRTRYPEKYQRLYEEHLIAAEAWKRAAGDLAKELAATYSTAGLRARVVTTRVWCWIVIVLGVITSFGAPIVGLPLALISGIVLAVSTSSLNGEIARRKGEAVKAKEQWLAKNPPPSESELRDFHDPQAELTDRDRRLQDIFDYWPGYPPYWQYVRRIVLARDERCQITGCPSRTEIHVHHRVPLAKGGSHRPENLVALCAFHHGLQPDVGHERVWAEITTRYFTGVCAQLRAGVPVRAHVRRLGLVTQQELLEILRFHGVCCPDCGSELLGLSVDYYSNKVSVTCSECGLQKMLPQKLTEETGPQLCEEWTPKQNIMSASVDWELMNGKRRRVGVRKGSRRNQTRARSRSPKCPLCGSLLTVRDGRYGKFWGCTSFPRCRYTRDHESNPRHRSRVSPN